MFGNMIIVNKNVISWWNSSLTGEILKWNYENVKVHYQVFQKEEVKSEIEIKI